MDAPHDIVFLLDVDNTLLDNDRATEDLRRHLTETYGPDRQERYWTIFEHLRATLGYTDYLGALSPSECLTPRRRDVLAATRFVSDGFRKPQAMPGS